MKKLFVITVFMVSILFFSLSNALAISSPTAVSPAVPYGETGPYYSTRTPTFSWTPVEGATWYQIYLSYSDTPGSALLKQWVKNAVSWTLLGDFRLYPGEEYSWWVRAYDGSYSSWSNRADFTVGRLKVISINPSAFVPGVPENLCSYRGGTALEPLQDYTAPDADNHWTTPLILPDYSSLEYLKLYFYNNGSVSNASVCKIRRHDFGYHMFYIYVLKTVSGTNEDDDWGNAVEYFSDIQERRIRNTLYHYSVEVALPSVNNWLLHVEIGYWD